MPVTHRIKRNSNNKITLVIKKSTDEQRKDVSLINLSNKENHSERNKSLISHHNACRTRVKKYLK